MIPRSSLPVGTTEWEVTVAAKRALANAQQLDVAQALPAATTTAPSPVSVTPAPSVEGRNCAGYNIYF